MSEKNISSTLDSSIKRFYNYNNNYYTKSEENKNYRNNLINQLKKYKYSPYSKKKKKAVVVYIDKPESYDKFLNNKSLYDEEGDNKILCIPSYLQHLYTPLKL